MLGQLIINVGIRTRLTDTNYTDTETAGPTILSVRRIVVLEIPTTHGVTRKRVVDELWSTIAGLFQVEVQGSAISSVLPQQHSTRSFPTRPFSSHTVSLLHHGSGNGSSPRTGTVSEAPIISDRNIWHAEIANTFALRGVTCLSPWTRERMWSIDACKSFCCKFPGWSYASDQNELSQQSTRKDSRLLDAFAERALSVCENHERRITDVYSTCIYV